MYYKGKKYTSREIVVSNPDIMEGEEHCILIGVQSLSDAMGDDKLVEGSIEKFIDEEIYYYIADDEIGADGKYMAENLLDETFVFICEGEDF